MTDSWVDSLALTVSDTKDTCSFGFDCSLLQEFTPDTATLVLVVCPRKLSWLLVRGCSVVQKHLLSAASFGPLSATVNDWQLALLLPVCCHFTADVIKLFLFLLYLIIKGLLIQHHQ